MTFGTSLGSSVVSSLQKERGYWLIMTKSMHQNVSGAIGSVLCIGGCNLGLHWSILHWVHFLAAVWCAVFKKKEDNCWLWPRACIKMCQERLVLSFVKIWWSAIWTYIPSKEKYGWKSSLKFGYLWLNFVDICWLLWEDVHWSACYISCCTKNNISIQKITFRWVRALQGSILRSLPGELLGV